MAAAGTGDPVTAGGHRRHRRVVTLGITLVVVIAVILGLGDHRIAAPAAAAPTNPAPTKPAPTKPAPDGDKGKEQKRKLPLAGDIMPDGTECVGSRYATLGHISNLVIDGIAATLPANLRSGAPQWKAAAQRDLKRAKVSMLWVSGPTTALSENEDAPIHDYRDPISQMIVTQLMNVREGKASKRITVDNLTLAQAIETVYLYAYATVLVPLTIFRRTIGKIGQIGPISIGTAISIPILLGVLGVNLLYKGISAVLLKACLDTMSPAEKAAAGEPNVPGGSPRDIPAAIRQVAAQVMVADPKTCPPIGDMPLSRVVGRTVDFMIATNPNPAARQRIARIAKDLNGVMRTTWAPVGAIPADPSDFTTVESVTSSLMTLIPYVGGAPTDMAIGWKHNLDAGQDPRKMVPLADVTVTKSLTAAYYGWALSAHIVSEAWSYAGVDATDQVVQMLVPGVDAAALMPRTGGILNAPNTYGLVVFHNVLRSMCLAEDARPAPADAEATARTGERGTPAARRW